MSLLIPFGAYMLAEDLGLLGHPGGRRRRGRHELHRAIRPRARRHPRPAERGLGRVQFALNGIIFVLLGEQLPQMPLAARDVVGLTGTTTPPGCSSTSSRSMPPSPTCASLWVWLSLRLTLARAAPAGAAVARRAGRLVAATALAGVRGAVTLAGVLTLPLTLDDGSPFPARDLAILLAAGTIIFSLVAASIGLPVLLKRLELPPSPRSRAKRTRPARRSGRGRHQRGSERAQHDADRAAQDADLYADVGAASWRSTASASHRRSETGDEAELMRDRRIERELRLVAIRAERDALYRLGRTRQISDETVRRLVRELDLVESRFYVNWGRARRHPCRAGGAGVADGARRLPVLERDRAIGGVIETEELPLASPDWSKSVSVGRQRASRAATSRPLTALAVRSTLAAEFEAAASRGLNASGRAFATKSRKKLAKKSSPRIVQKSERCRKQTRSRAPRRRCPWRGLP